MQETLSKDIEEIKNKKNKAVMRNKGFQERVVVTLYGLVNLNQDPKVKERTIWERRKSS